MKTAAIILGSLLAFAAVAAKADGVECRPKNFAVKTAVIAITKYKDFEFNIIDSDFLYDNGNKTCSGYALIVHADHADPEKFDGLQVSAPKN